MRALVLLLLLAPALSATSIEDPAGFSFTVPEGYLAWAAGTARPDPRAKYIFARRDGRNTGIMLSIAMERGLLAQPQSALDPNSHETWAGMLVPTFKSRAESRGEVAITHTCTIPISPDHISVTMRCTPGNEEAGLAALRQLLASLRGPTNWMPPTTQLPAPAPDSGAQRPADDSSAGAVVIVILVLVLLGGLVYIFRESLFAGSRGPAPAAPLAAGPPTAPLAGVAPPSGVAPTAAAAPPATAYPAPPASAPPPRNAAKPAPWEHAKGGTQIISPEPPPWERGKKP